MWHTFRVCFPEELEAIFQWLVYGVVICCFFERLPTSVPDSQARGLLCPVLERTAPASIAAATSQTSMVVPLTRKNWRAGFRLLVRSARYVAQRSWIDFEALDQPDRRSHERLVYTDWSPSFFQSQTSYSAGAAESDRQNSEREDEWSTKADVAPKFVSDFNRFFSERLPRIVF
jgi:hypothetical protein